jgi:hypothetical protein
MKLRKWLQRLLAVEGNVGHSFLHSLFRRSPKDFESLVKEEPKPGGREIFEYRTVRDDYQIRLGATRELVTSVPYSEVMAPLVELTRNTAADEMQIVLERLARLQQDAPIQFPLDIYWQAIGAGLHKADEWLHYGEGSHEPALILLLPTATAPPGKSENVFNFSLRCAAASPSPLRQL